MKNSKRIEKGYAILRPVRPVRPIASNDAGKHENGLRPVCVPPVGLRPVCVPPVGLRPVCVPPHRSLK